MKFAKVIKANRMTILILIIFSTFFLFHNCHAETYNALNISIINTTSGKVLYNKIVIKGEDFKDYTVKNGLIINISIAFNNLGYNDIFEVVNKKRVIINYNLSDIGSMSYSGGSHGIEIIISPINYTPPSTKAPIPIGASLLITAFLTYCVYRRSQVI